MVDGFDMPFPVPAMVLRRSILAGTLCFLASMSSAAPPAVPVYTPRAAIVGVERSFARKSSAAVPGAGVRAFEDPETEASGTERFEIRWYAHPPGIPPGVVVLLESVQERSSVLKNHPFRLDRKAEGHERTVIEIPPDEIRRAGRVAKWRIRLVWRGRLLASQASADWDG